jgi:enamine deaminase RidA (YjgF/YER057c/UK114 family)
MKLRSLAQIVLLGCCTVLAGCSGGQDQAGSGQSPQGAAGTDATSPQPAAEMPAAPAAEPAVRYVALEDPAGAARAVVVEGFPLVHTRQLRPLDQDGKLVGEGSAEQQIEQVLANLDAVLQAAGSELNKLVRLNIYVDAPQTAEQLNEQLTKRLDETVRPAITTVVTPLPDSRMLVAVDAVAIAADRGSAVSLQRCTAVAGDSECADAAVLPRGGLVYLSGHPEKGPLAAAAAKSLKALLGIVDELQLDRAQIVQLKVFVQPAAAADEVLAEIKRQFPGQLVPPVAFVEWIATAPVEIEMVLHQPLSGGDSAETVAYVTPAGMKASPTFSRVAVVRTDRQIYISGLSARAAGEGEAQVRDVFAQLQQLLDATDSDLRHLVKATYYVSDDDRTEGSSSALLNKLRPEYYDPQRPPAASKVRVHGVALTDRTLTMDMIAVGTGH